MIVAVPRRVLGVVTAAIGLIALRWSSVMPSGARHVEDRAQLRLSLSARPERIERCSELSDDELAKLPAHMRLRTRCEGYAARYLLTIAVGERDLTSDTLSGGGLRQDRPLHVFREHEVIPGPQRLHIELTRLDAGPAPFDADASRASLQATADTLLGGRADRERDERARRTAEAMPPRLVLDTLITIAARRVVLVTFDNNTRRLVARTEP